MKKRISTLFYIAILSCAIAANASVNIFTDTFDRPDNTDIDDSALGMSGVSIPVNYLETGDILTNNPGLTNIENNSLHLADGPNMSVFYINHNFTDSEILQNGGMKIGMTIVSNDGTADDNDRYTGFGIGNSLSECEDAGFDYNNPGFRGRIDYHTGFSDLWIGWSPNDGGKIQVYKNGPTSEGGSNYAVPNITLTGNDRLEIELLVDNFSSGTIVYANILWNTEIVDTTSFEWDYDNQNYIGFSTRQNDSGFTIDDITITAQQVAINPIINQFSVSPDTIDEDQTNAEITLSWVTELASANTTYEITSNKQVIFPDNNNAGTAVNGPQSVTAIVDGSLDDVSFTLTLLKNQNEITSSTANVSVMAIPAPDAPNIIVILLDDLGWADWGCYGSEIQTPTIDTLASQGVRFREFYQAARCSPSRLAILSGLYTQQAATNPGASLPPIRNDNNVTIGEVMENEGYRTYVSGKWHIGKKADNKDPLSRGFMHAYGQGAYADGTNTSSAFGYWNENDYHVYSTNNEVPEREYGENGKQFHYSDAIGDHAVDFISHHNSKNDNRPMFMYMAFNAPHWPVNAPASIANKYTDVGDPNSYDEDVCLYERGFDVIRAEKYQRQLAMGVIDKRFLLSPKGDHPSPPTAIPDWDNLSPQWQMYLARKQAVYAAMIEQVDQNIGKVVDKLAAEGMLNDTMIFICADNGANYEGGVLGNPNPWDPEHLDSLGQPRNAENASYPRENLGGAWANSSNTPFRLFKHFTHNGGLRTPALLFWPNRTAPEVVGTWTEQRGHLIDVMATAVDAARAKYPTSYKGRNVLPMEGTSLLPVLENKAMAARDIAVEHESNRAFFRGNYKFVTKNFSFTDGSSPAHELELYDMSKDPTEMNNLAESHPKILAEMINDWNAWAIRVGVPEARLITPPVIPELPNPDFSNAYLQDLFERNDNVDIDAETGGISGTMSPLPYIESYEGSGLSDSTQITGEKLQMATGNGMGVMYIDHNFVDPSIINSGGFAIMLDIWEINGGDAPEDRFGGFGIGLTQAEADSAGDISDAYALRPRADGSGAIALSDLFVDLALDGTLRVWTGNTLRHQYNVGQTYGRIRADILMPDFSSDNNAIARIYFNDTILGYESFNWDHINQNYIGLSARASNYVKMDNLVIIPFENIPIDNIDLTGEGNIDILDFAKISSQWLKKYVLPCPEADITGDCVVDYHDLQALSENWLETTE